MEADIAACFDEIDHAALMDRVRQRVKDKKVLALVKAFIKAGVMTSAGDRLTVNVLKAWRKEQIAERLAWGPTWSNPEDLVFTREDGRPLDPDWVYKEFVRLVQRAGCVHFRCTIYGTGRRVSSWQPVST